MIIYGAFNTCLEVIQTAHGVLLVLTLNIFDRILGEFTMECKPT